MIGVDYASMTATEQGFLAQYLQNNIADAWQRINWLDLCPYGEARFVGNVLTYPNDLTQSAVWTNTALTITANAIANPADGKVSASKLLETAATSAHKAAQTVSFIPNVNYQFSAYVRPSGRNYIYHAVNDGSVTHSCYFNTSAGSVGTAANVSQTSTIQQCSNGFWLCTIYFKADASAGSGSAAVQLSSDGATLSYAGDTSLGAYVWGALLLQTTYAAPTSLTIPWKQTGEDAIDTIFCAWKDYPSSTKHPRPQGYTLTPDGIEIIGTSGWGGYINNYLGYTPPQSFLNGNPVYVYYRKDMPLFFGDAFDATAVYPVGDQVSFENSEGVTDYWKCVVQTTASQTPDSTPASWSVVEIPSVFFHFAIKASYADWLRMDGQFDKAQAADLAAEEWLTIELDRQERQMAWMQPMTVVTHVRSQSRL